MTDKSIEERCGRQAEHMRWYGFEGVAQTLDDAAVELRRLRFMSDLLQMSNESLRREVERLREATDVARASDQLRCADEEAEWQAAEIRRLQDELAEYKRFTFEYRDHCAELDDERRAMRIQLKEKTERSESAEEESVRSEQFLKAFTLANELLQSELAKEFARRESAEKALDELESQLHRDERPVRMQLREEAARRESAEAALRQRLPCTVCSDPEGVARVYGEPNGKCWACSGAREHFSKYEPEKETT